MVHELFETPLSQVEEVLDRFLEIEQEAFPTADCVPYFFYTGGGGFPYFTHRLGAINTELLSSQYSVDSFTIIVRIVVAHFNEGYAGQAEVEISRLLSTLLHMFMRRPQLQSEAYPDAMDDLSPTGIQVQEVRGLSVFDDDGIGSESQVVRQVGTEITVLVPFVTDIEEDY